MDEHLLRAGEFLARTRLSPEALRLYGTRGLPAPVRIDARTGWRWYAPAQVERARCTTSPCARPASSPC